MSRLGIRIQKENHREKELFYYIIIWAYILTRFITGVIQSDGEADYLTEVTESGFPGFPTVSLLLITLVLP